MVVSRREDATSFRGGTRPVLVWFRRDLRLSDNPALEWAVGTGCPVIPVFILDEDTGDTALGGASSWWLHGSLDALATTLRALGSHLVLRRGRADAVLNALFKETGATAIVWNRLTEPAAMARDRRIKARIATTGIVTRSFNAALLFEPWTVQTGSSTPNRVFTPFWRRCLAHGFETPGGAVTHLPSPKRWPDSDKLTAWGLRCLNPDWAAGLRRTWQPGEAGARERLDHFLHDAATDYQDGRERPGEAGTSRLSPHLRFGEIGPRQVAAAIREHAPGPGGEAFLREIGWREFAHHLLFHNPHMETEPLRPVFTRMCWRNDPAGLAAWQRGRTGYPLVDAGMRQLWTTGWMHNRVRMVAASFLTKNLLVDWRAGAAWFLDTLVDADRANNSADWQWVAGSGADAMPYNRIFNPVAQSERFDRGGFYLRHWLPELRWLPDRYLHAPWTAPRSVLNTAGIDLGKTTPLPIVDHSNARERSLAAWRCLRQSDSDRPESANGENDPERKK